MNSNQLHENVLPLNSLRITTGSRLHFGLLDVLPPFGGVGVMIRHPETEVLVESADHFVCEGDGHGRVIDVARRFQKHIGFSEMPCCRIQVVHRPKPHTGMGTGTQLAMTIAQSLASYVGKNIPRSDLATLVANRGKRSAVGVHGFFEGGLIFERPNAEKTESTSFGQLNPIHTRVALPDNWHVVLLTPEQGESTVSGDAEQQQFDELLPTSSIYRERLEELVIRQMIPAVERNDFNEFANAVHQYNRQSGMMFANVQGGPYNGARVTELVERLVLAGALGVGQSSWGPTVFSWFQTKDAAEEFVENFHCPDQSVLITNACNQPRSMQPTPC